MKHFTTFIKQTEQWFPVNPKHKFELADGLLKHERPELDRNVKMWLQRNESKPRVSYSEIYGGPLPRFLELRGLERK